MATYKIRGTSHNVIYTYRTERGEVKQHWESYDTELEAIQRKAYIDHLQKNKKHEEIRAAALEYRRNRAIAKAERDAAHSSPPAEN